MYIITNALKNLIRNKGRNTIAGIIILAIIVTTAVSMIINTTAEGIIDDYKTRFGSSVNIYPDMEKMQANGVMEGFSSTPLSFAQYEKLAKSSALKSYVFRNELMGKSDSLKAVAQDEEKKQGDGAKIFADAEGGKEGDAPVAIQLTLKVKGTTDYESLSEFKDGLRKITSGNMYKDLNECIVSEELAKLNNLTLGDEIKITNQVSETKQVATLKVVGIYKDLTDEYGGSPYKTPFLNKRNEILTSFDTVMKNSDDNAGMVASFMLKSPEELEAFTKDARAAGLNDTYKISTDDASYEKVVGPVEGLTKITTVFMWIVLVLGGIILFLLSSMAIRERKYEIGVLRAMGMRKSRVAVQFLSEMLALTACCLVIGTSIGMLISQPVANNLLENQIKIVEEQKTKENSMGGSNIGGITAKDDTPTIKELKVSLHTNSVIRIALIALLLATLSSLVSIIYITKYEPIKILSERN